LWIAIGDSVTIEIMMTRCDGDACRMSVAITSMNLMIISIASQTRRIHVGRISVFEGQNRPTVLVVYEDCRTIPKLALYADTTEVSGQPFSV
jgi:hypothetical protein